MNSDLLIAFLCIISFTSCGHWKSSYHMAESGEAYEDSRDAARHKIVRSRPLDKDQKKVLPQSYVRDISVINASLNEEGDRHDDSDRDMGSPNNSGSRVV